MPRDVRCLGALKNLVVHAIGVQDTKRVKKIYYRYPMEVDGNFHFKRYRLRDDEDVKLIRGSAPPEGMPQDEFESHEGSVVGDPMTESFHLDPDQEDGRYEDEEELNPFRISLAQPAISQPYECPAHFSALNLDAMNSEFCLR
ncbi:hypothetical protein PIB30_040936 [Stylosanthes scabra]|uniref:Uncharacterized protein n=1 Tax=Stylosanthes scabra TaxID=79078 RepID=A0ABU6ZDG5_9FABA|nr:hypothetical protein [Stylosanthes scabra]